MSNLQSVEIGNDPNPDGVGLSKLRQQLMSYTSVKTAEVDEARASWRYYHTKQFTREQLAILRRRGQPAIVFNRMQRKIDGLVGTIRRLRTDPKAFARTEDGEAGAETATACLRYVFDACHFEDTETECVRDVGVAGILCAEMEIVAGDHGDPDIAFAYTDPRTFFYDPRSVKPDFSDARYMGTYKWCSLDEIEEILPGATDTLKNGGGTGADDGGISTGYDADRDMLWTDDKERRRLVDHWYIKGGQWYYCLHVGTIKLDGGPSPFFDEKNRSICKYFPTSYYIDDDGDRYGLGRPMKGPQDAINQHRSKAVHIMNTRQLLIEESALLLGDGETGDIEKMRRELIKPDGVMVFPDGALANGSVRIETGDGEFLKQTKYFEEALAEIENYGPNLSLVGDSSRGASGRSLAIQQQAGLAELGPLLKNYRSWKLKMYRAAWCALQRYWTAERWIRVTDDEKIAQFMQLNALQLDEYRQPVIVNALGSIDVDILLDEGPDTETVMGDTNDVLEALAQNAVPVPPEMIIESSSLPRSKKDKMLATMEQAKQADPMADTAKQIALSGEAAKNDKVLAETELDRAKTAQIGFEMGAAASGAGVPGVGAPMPAQKGADFGSPAPAPAMAPMDGSQGGPAGFAVPAAASAAPGTALVPAPPQPMAAMAPPAPVGPAPLAEGHDENVMSAIEFLAAQTDELAQKFDMLMRTLQARPPSPAAPPPIPYGTYTPPPHDDLREMVVQLARVMAAPTELVRDAQGRPAGTRKILPDMPAADTGEAMIAAE